MQTLIQMILPSLVLPFFLSAMLWQLARSNQSILWALPLIWLPSYLWLLGWPSWFPVEANQWLWWLVVASVGINFILQSRMALVTAMQSLLLAMVLIAAAWPVLKYQFDIKLVIELLVVIVVGVVTFRYSSKGQATAPALTMVISCGGMGLVVALGGSLLVGQLAGALASVLFAFAISELVKKLKPSISPLHLLPVMQLYLVILVIARIFAEIPLGPSALLLVAPLLGLITATRYAFVLSTASVSAAMSWLLLTADSSSYY